MQIKLVLKLIIITFALSKFAYAAEDEHDHDHSAHSDEPFYGHIGIRLHVDHISDSAEGSENINEIYTHSHIELGASLAEGFNIDTNLKVEGEPAGHAHGGVRRTADGNSRVFEDHPLIVESLTLTYSHEDFSAYIGKFNPKVGLNYHTFPGLYSYSMIEEYKIAERIGVGLNYSVNLEDFGTHKLDISSFFADTTFLSDALLDQRGHTSKEDGGLANTEDLDSYAISLGGKDFYSLDNNIAERLFYKLGYALQKKGTNNDNDETRYSISLGYKENFTSKINTTLIFEHMEINHYSGEAGHDRSYFTSSMGLKLYPWSFATTYTFVDNDAEEADEGADGKILQISVGYSISSSVDVNFGFKRADEELEVTERFGLGLRYRFEL
ncbi:MAG: hypothetical protein CMD90_01565 [Gammaproteobacteria bacterium]|nr:hypothetical protein [Gammaproteobacteria bacterium]|tara:strand:- start:1585 stop:2733 length:1149 start_codon:yes stop_codon:yes gene_type:complete